MNDEWGIVPARGGPAACSGASPPMLSLTWLVNRSCGIGQPLGGFVPARGGPAACSGVSPSLSISTAVTGRVISVIALLLATALTSAGYKCQCLSTWPDLKPDGAAVAGATVHAV